MRKERIGKSGQGLLTVFVFVIIISVTVVSILALAKTKVELSNRQMRHLQAYYIGESEITWAFRRLDMGLTATTSWTSFPDVWGMEYMIDIPDTTAAGIYHVRTRVRKWRP